MQVAILGVKTEMSKIKYRLNGIKKEKSINLNTQQQKISQIKYKQKKNLKDK